MDIAMPVTTTSGNPFPVESAAIVFSCFPFLDGSSHLSSYPRPLPTKPNRSDCAGAQLKQPQ
ncbi:hypothetical protein I553_2054 [Mycobacterium xenopi 4042]|uniref:Uncharacterized protein n=1 Tax=Mycobacterium xenopi 4042 TaxID=1299334 RepID=X8DLF2_MYCXE|nr:hypothetical protein I553_2054 [Mycobacterium xenopi 4042]